MRFSAAWTASAGRLARGHFVGDEEGGDFGIGFGGEAMALGGEFLAQSLEVLDDAVVDDGEAVAGVRVGVALGRLAVGRPAGVADADRTAERMGGELGLEVLELALRAQPRQAPVLERRDRPRSHSRDIPAASARRRSGRDRPMSQNADDSAHEKTLKTRFGPSKG